MKRASCNNSLDKTLIPSDASMILGISYMLSSTSEVASSTILPLAECQRRLAFISNEIKTERCAGFAKDLVTKVEWDYDASDLFTEFEEPRRSQQTETDISALVKEFECEYIGIIDDDYEIEEEPKAEITDAETFETFPPLPQELIDKINMISLQLQEQQNERSKKCQVEGPVDCKKEVKEECKAECQEEFSNEDIKRKRPRSSSSQPRKKRKIIKNRGPPIPQLGRSFQKKVLPASKSKVNYLLYSYRNSRMSKLTREIQNLQLNELTREIKKEYDCATEN